jgi:hypothetical protein
VWSGVTPEGDGVYSSKWSFSPTAEAWFTFNLRSGEACIRPKDDPEWFVSPFAALTGAEPSKLNTRDPAESALLGHPRALSTAQHIAAERGEDVDALVARVEELMQSGWAPDLAAIEVVIAQWRQAIGRGDRSAAEEAASHTASLRTPLAAAIALLVSRNRHPSELSRDDLDRLRLDLRAETCAAALHAISNPKQMRDLLSPRRSFTPEELGRIRSAGEDLAAVAALVEEATDGERETILTRADRVSRLRDIRAPQIILEGDLHTLSEALKAMSSRTRLTDR